MEWRNCGMASAGRYIRVLIPMARNTHHPLKPSNSITQEAQQNPAVGHHSQLIPVYHADTANAMLDRPATEPPIRRARAPRRSILQVNFMESILGMTHDSISIQSSVRLPD